MNFAMKLHYQLLAAESDALPVLLIHGLFGNLDNLGAVSYTHLTLPTICSV